jgi:hypothetical protein
MEEQHLNKNLIYNTNELVTRQTQQIDRKKNSRINQQ